MTLYKSKKDGTLRFVVKPKGKMQRSKIDELYNEYFSLSEKSIELQSELTKVNCRLAKVTQDMEELNK